jgi:hypothetical protein
MEVQEGARWIRGATAVTTRGLPHQGVKGGPCGIMISAILRIRSKLSASAGIYPHPRDTSASAKTYPHIHTSAHPHIRTSAHPHIRNFF